MVRLRPLNYKQVFMTTISNTREESMELKRNNKAIIRVYSNRSGYEGGAGAAAVLYKGESV
jgi:hypothetical protein